MLNGVTHGAYHQQVGPDCRFLSTRSYTAHKISMLRFPLACAVRLPWTTVMQPVGWGGKGGVVIQLYCLDTHDHCEELAMLPTAPSSWSQIKRPYGISINNKSYSVVDTYRTHSLVHNNQSMPMSSSLLPPYLPGMRLTMQLLG